MSEIETKAQFMERTAGVNALKRIELRTRIGTAIARAASIPICINAEYGQHADATLEEFRKAGWAIKFSSD